MAAKPADRFCLWCVACGLPAPVREFRFDPERRWRFDYAWPDARVAVEQEGGVWTKGRHVQPLGYLNDLEKYNAATLAGWRILRYTPEQLTTQPTLDALRSLITKESA